MQQGLNLTIGAHEVGSRFIGAIFLKADRGLTKLRPQRVGVGTISIAVEGKSLSLDLPVFTRSVTAGRTNP
jgi:hypothetical protein